MTINFDRLPEPNTTSEPKVNLNNGTIQCPIDRTDKAT